MLQVLKTEWMKVRSYRTFWILTALCFVGMVGLNYIVWDFPVKVNGNADKAQTQALLGHPYSYPNVWETTSWLSGWLLFLPGLLIIMLITNEYTYRTHRQNVIDGWPRAAFINAKLLWVVSLAVLCTLASALSAVIFGALGDAPFSTSGMEYVFYFFLETLSYLMMALLFGVLFRRSGLAIALYFVYILLLKFLLAGLIDWMTHGRAGDYVPLRVTDELLPLPVFRDMAKRPNREPLPVAALLSATAVYLGIFYAWMLYKFRNDNL